MVKSKPQARIEDWHRLPGDTGLAGRVFDHPEIPDGEYVRTSTILHLDTEAGECETRNTLYKLGASLSDRIRKEL